MRNKKPLHDVVSILTDVKLRAIIRHHEVKMYRMMAYGILLERKRKGMRQ